MFKKEDGQYWAWASLGAIVLNTVSLIAFIGWLLALIVYLAAFGTIGKLLYESVWTRRSGEGDGEQLTSDVNQHEKETQDHNDTGDDAGTR